jgi:hypothetical protein
MSWKILYPIDDIEPYMPKDYVLGEVIKAMLYSGIDPRVHDTAALTDRLIKTLHAARSRYYRMLKEKK